MLRPALVAVLTLAAAAPVLARTPTSAAAPAPAPAATPIAIRPAGTLEGWLQCRAAAQSVTDFLKSQRSAAPAEHQARIDQQLRVLPIISEGARQGSEFVNRTAGVAPAELTRQEQGYLAEFTRPDGLSAAGQVLDVCQTELMKHMEQPAPGAAPPAPPPATKK